MVRSLLRAVFPAMPPESQCCANVPGSGSHCYPKRLGIRIRGTLGDIDPLNKVPFKRPTSRVEEGPL